MTFGLGNAHAMQKHPPISSTHGALSMPLDELSTKLGGVGIELNLYSRGSILLYFLTKTIVPLRTQ